MTQEPFASVYTSAVPNQQKRPYGFDGRNADIAGRFPPVGHWPAMSEPHRAGQPSVEPLAQNANSRVFPYPVVCRHRPDNALR